MHRLYDAETMHDDEFAANLERWGLTGDGAGAMQMDEIVSLALGHVMVGDDHGAAVVVATWNHTRAASEAAVAHYAKTVVPILRRVSTEL